MDEQIDILEEPIDILEPNQTRVEPPKMMECLV